MVEIERIPVGRENDDVRLQRSDPIQNCLVDGNAGWPEAYLQTDNGRAEGCGELCQPDARLMLHSAEPGEQVCRMGISPKQDQRLRRTCCGGIETIFAERCG